MSGSERKRMVSKRYFAKQHATDANQVPIVEALTAIGCKVYSMERPVDLLVEFRAIWIVIEVKNKAGKNELTKAQIDFFSKTTAPAYIVRSPTEAIDVVQSAWRKLFLK